MRRLTHLVVLVAFVFSCGGQWAAIQCFAWANMIHEYSQMVPLSQAVSMTFSGQYPCAICKALAEKKNSENQKLLAADKHTVKFFAPAALSLTRLFPTEFSYGRESDSALARPISPPTPPPRLVLS